MPREIESPMTADVERARGLLAEAKRIVVLTGAGISAESGVPTFRGPGGLWKSFRPEELATPDAFARDPCLVWEWYAWRRSLVEEHLLEANLYSGLCCRYSLYIHPKCLCVGSSYQ